MSRLLLILISIFNNIQTFAQNCSLQRFIFAFKFKIKLKKLSCPRTEWMIEKLSIPILDYFFNL